MSRRHLHRHYPGMNRGHSMQAVWIANGPSVPIDPARACRSARERQDRPADCEAHNQQHANLHGPRSRPHRHPNILGKNATHSRIWTRSDRSRIELQSSSSRSAKSLTKNASHIPTIQRNHTIEPSERLPRTAGAWLSSPDAVPSVGRLRLLLRHGGDSPYVGCGQRRRRA
jgi:hypothetical protein